MDDLMEKKKWLIKISILMQFIEKFHSQMNGIIKNNKKIMNSVNIINANVIYSLDNEFRSFIRKLHYWWLFFHTLNHDMPEM